MLNDENIYIKHIYFVYVLQINTLCLTENIFVHKKTFVKLRLFSYEPQARLKDLIK